MGNLKIPVDMAAQCAYLLINETENNKQHGDEMGKRINTEILEGRDYWYQYVRINGYAFEPKNDGLKKLSKNIDININHLKKCITAYLES